MRIGSCLPLPAVRSGLPEAGKRGWQGTDLEQSPGSVNKKNSVIPAIELWGTDHRFPMKCFLSRRSSSNFDQSAIGSSKTPVGGGRGEEGGR